MFKKLKIYIYLLVVLTTLSACKTVTNKIDQSTELEKKAIIENNILNNYRKNVLFELTSGGAIEISVTHTDPQKASSYANNFMEEIRQIVEKESTINWPM